MKKRGKYVGPSVLINCFGQHDVVMASVYGDDNCISWWEVE